DTQGDEVQALERTLRGRYVHAHRPLDIEAMFPGDAAHEIVDVALAPIAALRHTPQHPAGDSAVQVHAVAQVERPREAHPAVGRLERLGSERHEFLVQHGFEAAWTGTKEMLRAARVNARRGWVRTASTGRAARTATIGRHTRLSQL